MALIPWYIKAQQFREQLDLQYADIAEVLGVTVSAVGHYLNGRRNPSVEQVQKIAKLMGKSMSELCGEDPFFIVDKNERKIISIVRDMPDDIVLTALEILEALAKRANRPPDDQD